MNKNLLIILSVCFTFAACLSCKKTTKSSVQHDDIMGKWRRTRVAIDTNGNKKIDDLELLSPSSYDSTHVLVFNSDGSGLITSSNVSVGTFSWSLENNNTYLRIDYAGSATGTITQHIDTLSSSAMTLRDTTGVSVVWNLYTKQH